MAAAPDVVGEILAIPVSQVDLGDRLRAIDPVWAPALGAIMRAEGQHTPIEVCRLPGSSRYRLVAGGHRLEGARLTGLATIDAIVVDSNAIGRRAREVSENLWRKGLDPIDRAAFVAELYALQKAKAGLARDEDAHKLSITARWRGGLKSDADDTSVGLTLVFGWADGVADHIGLSRKTIYRDLELHRGLPPSVVAALRHHPVSRNAGQLRALARMSPDDQRACVALILARDAKGATDALAILQQKHKPTAEAKAWSAFFGGWSRMSAGRRRDALRELAQQGLPAGFRLVVEQGE